MSRIAVIGIVGNSVFMNADHFHEKGETVVADSVYEEVGGKGSNQAVAAVRMGAQVSFLAAIGDDAGGEICRQVMQENGVDGVYCIKPGKRTPFAYILKDKHGENRVTEYKSAELTPEDVQAFEPQIANADILMLQHEVPHEVNLEAALIARKHGVPVILNPAPFRPVPEELTELVEYVTPNEHEAKGLEGQVFPNVIKTLGDKGCLINDQFPINAICVKAVDTTGAGDTFNGTMAVCLAEGMDLQTACRYAVVASGISVSRHYVLKAIPFRSEVEAILCK